jgi:hypothetical protein
MRRLVHAMNFLLIAATNTGRPASPGLGPAVLATPRLFVRLGVAGGLLIVTGGLVYSTGAAVYAWVVLTRCPPPSATTKRHEQVLRQTLMAFTAGASMSDTRIPARRPCRCSYGRVRLIADPMKKGATVIC